MKRFWLVALLFPGVLTAQERSFRWTDRYVLGVEQDLSATLTFTDVDGDGDMDPLVANGRHWPQRNEIFLNNGAGRFTVSYELGAQSATTYAIPAGDLDGDGDVDVVVVNDMAENWVYLNDGHLGFEEKRNYGTESDETRSAALADLNGDGILDIVNANIGEPNGIYLGDGSGGFDHGTSVGGGEQSYALALLDVDHDGDVDIVVANVGGRNELYLNDGSGTVWTRSSIGEQSDVTYGVAEADLNGDGFATCESTKTPFGETAGRTWPRTGSTRLGAVTSG